MKLSAAGRGLEYYDYKDEDDAPIGGSSTFTSLSRLVSVYHTSSTTLIPVCGIVEIRSSPLSTQEDSRLRQHALYRKSIASRSTKPSACPCIAVASPGGYQEEGTVPVTSDDHRPTSTALSPTRSGADDRFAILQFPGFTIYLYGTSNASLDTRTCRHGTDLDRFA